MAIVDTLGIADELAWEGVFSREQAERLARVRGRVATEALVTRADLGTAIALLRKDLEQTAAALRSELQASTAVLRSEIEASTAVLRNEFEARLRGMAKELVRWFAGILLAHGIAVIGVTVTLVKLL